MTQPRKRLSVSAIRDYNKCGRFYYFKRVQKLPDPMSHHAPAGTLVHNAFYAGYGQPTTQMDPDSGRMKTQWYVHGKFDPAMSLAIFDLFWARYSTTQTFDELFQHVQDKSWAEEPAKRDELEHYFTALEAEMPVVENFRPGQLKALGKGQKFSQAQLKQGWGGYYRTMLAGIVERPLPHPVKEIEREVVWNQDGVDMIGYMDIVMESGPGQEIGVDLKTAFNKPNEKELIMEDQMLGYYEAAERTNPNVQMTAFYYWHLRSGEMYLVRDNKKTRQFLKVAAVHVSNKIAAQDWSPRFDKETCAMCTYWSQCTKTPSLGIGPFDHAIEPLSESAPTPVPAVEYVPAVLF